MIRSAIAKVSYQLVARRCCKVAPGVFTSHTWGDVHVIGGPSSGSLRSE